jgi:hypothetical protein
VTARLSTEVALTIGGTRIEAGEYSVFIERSSECETPL